MARRPAALAFLMAVLVAATAAARPARVVSLDLCTDQLVLALAEPGQIAAVSWLARDCTLSLRCAQAGDVPVHYGTGEELVAASADLVVVGRHAARGAVSVARARGLPVLELDSPRDLEEMRAQLLRMGEALGQPGKAAAMAAELDTRLAGLPPPPAPAERPVAVLYQANGTTVGPGTLVDAVFERAGLANLAGRAGSAAYGYLPLELLVRHAPDLLVVEREDAWPPSLAEQMIRHPALGALFGPDRRVVVPQRLWICGGMGNLEAVERLAQARHAVAETADGR
ncbi:ABC transporter substrate-binding protein [Geminicoccaceae bacterium 1502E]|nr:ABC transporter substrate-binding protein [Geminicoccaceae bacterium 1502E]